MEFRETELKDKFGIYAIVNLISGGVYIGQTKQRFIKRYWHHNWKLNNGTHDNKYLQNSWNLYGEKFFRFMPVHCIDDASQLDELEIRCIQRCRILGKCYNLTDGGEGSRGIVISEEHKRRIAEKNRINMLGRKHSETTKKKMSEVRKGKVHLHSSYIKYTPEIARQIKIKLMNNESPSSIAKELNVDYRLVNGILSSNSWSTVYVSGWDEFRKNRKKKYTRLTKQDHCNIYNQFKSGKHTKQELAEIYGKTRSMINKIIRDYKRRDIE